MVLGLLGGVMARHARHQALVLLAVDRLAAGSHEEPVPPGLARGTRTGRELHAVDDDSCRGDDDEPVRPPRHERRDRHG
jgi:hypothetical protein